ncbi:MAG: 6-phosphogluconolactonase [Bacteroidales bacterium]
MDKIVKIFHSPYDLSKELAQEMVNMMAESAEKDKQFTVALSGGSTPGLLFTILSKDFAKSVSWKNVHIFWGDERCVPPGNAESNFWMAKKILLDKIEIPDDNIHRIKGEDDPAREAPRYSAEISVFTRKRDELPLFDLILLGLGEDGHTASIFPGNMELLNSDKVCDVAFHPVTRQKRITITGRIINNADTVAFLVAGRKKEKIVEKMFKNDPSALKYPASHIVPVYGSLKWFIDKEAGRLL